MNIQYRTDVVPDIDEIIDLYNKAGLPRPTSDHARMREIFQHSNLVVTAWANDRLVGIARSITDWRWSCYLADLAVDPQFQKHGIGKELIRLTKERVGDESIVILLSVPQAMTYYPRVGMDVVDNGFILHRKK